MSPVRDTGTPGHRDTRDTRDTGTPLHILVCALGGEGGGVLMRRIAFFTGVAQA